MTWRTCDKTGKRCLTRSQAHSQARWWRVKRFAVMHHYRCRHCGAWHIGNRRP